MGGSTQATSEGLIGHWPLTPKEPFRMEWRAEDATSKTWKTGSAWNSGNASVPTITLPGGDMVWERTSNQGLFSSTLIPVDPSKTYRLSGRFRSTGSGGDSKLYFGYTPHYSDGTYASNKAFVNQGSSVATVNAVNDALLSTQEELIGWDNAAAPKDRYLGIYYDGHTADNKPDYIHSTDSEITISAQNCNDWLSEGYTTDGYYWIHPANGNAIEVFCDMTTDGGGWTRLFVHKTSGGFWSGLDASSHNVDDPTADLYSVLEKLEDFRGGDGKFKLRINWPDLGAGKNIWKQSLNPVTTPGMSPTNPVAGYEALDIDYTSNSWGGLDNSSGSTFLNGTVNHGNWYYSIGSNNIWSTGIPAYGAASTHVELWVQGDVSAAIEDKTITTTTSIPAGIQSLIIPGVSAIRNHASGSGTYLYPAATGNLIPDTWSTRSADSTGDGWSDTAHTNFRPGTKYVRIMMLLNYGQDSSYTIQFDDIILEEVQGAEDSTDGSFFARDESPIRSLATTDRHHGEVYGATFGDGINGEPRGAMHFDGTDYIDLPDDIGYTDQVSAFSWFKAEGSPPGNYHIIFGGAGLEVSIHPSGYLRTGINTTTRYVSNHGTGLLDGNWHHVGFTFQNEEKKAYIDGTLVGTYAAPGALNPIVSDRRIGQFGTASYFLNGSVADVRLYDRALSATEVATLAGSGSSFVGTSKISTINSGTSAAEGQLYYNFETGKFWEGQSDGTVTQTTTPSTHKTSAQITSLNGTALDGYYYYDTEARQFYVGQPDGSLQRLTD